MQLVANGTTALWVDTDTFKSTAGVTKLRGRLILADKTGNFQVRPGIQTALDLELPDAPLIPATGGTGIAQYVAIVGRNFVDYDPTNASNGNISVKANYRNGLWYASSDSTVSRGDVIFELYEVD